SDEKRPSHGLSARSCYTAFVHTHQNVLGRLLSAQGGAHMFGGRRYVQAASVAFALASFFGAGASAEAQPLDASSRSFLGDLRDLSAAPPTLAALGASPGAAPGTGASFEGLD